MKALLLCSLIFLTGCPAARSVATGLLQGMTRNIQRSQDQQAGMSAYEVERLALERERLEIERQRRLYDQYRLLGIFR